MFKFASICDLPFLAGRTNDAGLSFVLEPIALALDLDDLGVMQQARVSYMGSTRAKARREHKPNGPLFHRCVAPFCAGIDNATILQN